MTVINVSELRKAIHSTVLSKLLPKNKAAVNTVLPLAHALLQQTFKENAPGYILLTQKSLSFFKKIRFTPCKAEQPLGGMELQDEEVRKD